MTRGANHGGQGARQTLRAGAVVAVVLAPSLAACAAGFDESFSTPAPVSEATTSKGLAVSVGPAPLRFAVPVRVEPPSFAARVDVFVQTASRPLRVEVLPESFASDDPAAWALVGPGAVLETFLSGQQDETLRLSLAHDPDDVADPIAVHLSLQLVAPGDVDLDGIDDAVTVAFGALAPLPP